MRALSVIIISYNEQEKISRCIRSVSAIADEVIVLDSYSTDETVSIALSLGATVRQSTFDGYIIQKNKAINLAKYDLVLLLDADEALDEALSASITEIKINSLFNAYTMNRCSRLCGKFIRNGLWYPDKKLRLFNKLMGKCVGLDPHDKILMNPEIQVKHLKGEILHYAFDSVEEYQERNNAVSLIAAQSLFEAGIKRHWSRIILSPLWAFLNGYLLKGGFLDGYIGYVIAINTANQCYVKYQRLRQLRRHGFKKIIWE